MIMKDVKVVWLSSLVNLCCFVRFVGVFVMGWVYVCFKLVVMGCDYVDVIWLINLWKSVCLLVELCIGLVVCFGWGIMFNMWWFFDRILVIFVIVLFGLFL